MSRFELRRDDDGFLYEDGDGYKYFLNVWNHWLSDNYYYVTFSPLRNPDLIDGKIIKARNPFQAVREMLSFKGHYLPLNSLFNTDLSETNIKIIEKNGSTFIRIDGNMEEVKNKEDEK